MKNTFQSLILTALMAGALLTACNSSKSNQNTEETDSATTQSADTLNTLTDAEKQAGWMLLFDGKTLDGWHSYGMQGVGPKWKIDDNAIMLDPKQDAGGDAKDSDLTTDAEYGDFELALDTKIDTCGNSGVIYRAVEAEKYDYAWQTGLEMQVLDNACHPDAKIEKHRAGDLYDIIKSTEEPVKPALEWNSVRVVAKGNHLEHWMNGVKVVDIEMGTDDWKKRIADSKWKDYPDIASAMQGHIVLQEHGARVWFRNIKLRKL